MSLVTISSKRNTEVQRNTDPAIIRNHFKDGLVLREGTEVGLVSLTINKLNLYEIIAGQNDTFIWRIGSRQIFEQHSVIVSAGNYNGDDLATEIALRVNNSTILGNYFNTWVCTYDQTAQSGEGAFTLNYGQNETPSLNKQTFSVYEGGTPTFSNNGTATVEITGEKSDDFELGDNPLIITGNKGIFPNEGETQTIIRPQEGYTLADQANALKLQTVTLTINGTTPPSTDDGTFIDTTGAPATQGWQLELQYADSSPSDYWIYLGDGEWGQSDDPTLTANRANCAFFYFYNPTRELYADADNGGRHANIAGVGSFIKYSNPATPLAVPKANVGYGKTVAGYVRNYLYKGRENYPANTNADILNTSPQGFDITVTCEDDDANLQVKFSLGRMVQNQGIEFPLPNWRNNSTLVSDFTDLNPISDFNSLPAISGVTPANWTSFTYGTDHIRIRVKIDKIIRVSIFLAHDTAGDGVFIEEQLCRQTGGNNGFNSTIKEKFFPLRPCLAISRGNNYYGSRYILKGVFDETEVVNPNFQVANANTVLHLGDDIETVDESETVSDDKVGAVPANALTLSALYKFGEIYASDETGSAPSGGLPLADHQPAGNIHALLGYDRLYNFSSGNTTNSIISTSNPITSIAEPTLSLELPDFNIKGANGGTGDSMRVIAVVPKEELNTNEKTGTLHYYPTFPIMIDLNLAQESIFYDLNAILRLPDGRVANDLINPTEITLLFKEGDESKQKRMLKAQAGILVSMMGNHQSAKINGIGNGNPLL